MATRGRRGRAAAAGVEGGALEISRFMGRALFSVDDKRVYCHCIMFPECQADVIMTALFWPIMRSDGVECSSRVPVSRDLYVLSVDRSSILDRLSTFCMSKSASAISMRFSFTRGFSQLQPPRALRVLRSA